MVGGALAVVRGILDGRYGPGAEDAFAFSTLRSLGLDRAEAQAIATLELDETVTTISAPDGSEPRAAA
jgi:hypothetical protein